jgi:hypothetical protein
VRLEVRDDASTGAPAGTIISTRRGRSSAAISSAGDAAPIAFVPEAGPSMKARVRTGSRS